MAGAGVALAVAGCGSHAPKGQVLATVNGQEITGQDVAAEARARGGAPGVPPQALLQGVIGRVLLAQAGHDKKLDHAPGYPSDLTRLKDDFLARRMLATVLKPPAQPTAAQISQAISSQPFKFARRARISIKQLKFTGADALQSVAGLETLEAIADRLKTLGVPFDQGSSTVDTAQLPDVLAAHMLDQPPGSLLTIREGDATTEIVVQSREPVNTSPSQQQAEATLLLQQQDSEKQVQAELIRLKQQATISYQAGYAPPKPAVKPPA